MSSVGVKGAKAMIPRDDRRVVASIKEITGQNHSDDEIYATLKECSMDPDETLQKLFLLDTFHEVKRKRSRRKEDQNKEKLGSHSRANRTNRYIHSSRHISNDAGGRKLLPGKEATTVHLPEKGNGNASLSAAEDAKGNMSSTMASPFTSLSNGASAVSSQSNCVIVGDHQSIGDKCANHLSAAINHVPTSKPAPASTSDPVLVGSHDLSIPSSVEIIERDAESPHAPVQVIANYPFKSRSASARVVVPAKEWKPKTVIPNCDQVANPAPLSGVSVVSAESRSELLTSPVLTLEEVTSELEKKFEKLNVSGRQHVIIPDHLHVPEVEKLGFCFGSFGASFGLDMNKNDGPGSAETSIIRDSSVAVEEHEPVRELQISDQNVSMALVDTEVKDPERPESPSQEPENLPSCELEVSSTTIDYKETKKEIAPGTHPNPLGHAPSNNNTSHVPPVSVPRSFDPSSYNAQHYGAGLDTDSRMSPFHILEPATKYGGHASLVSTQTSQTLQEFQFQSGVGLVLTTTSPAPLVTQAAGGIQGSIPPTHQSLTVVRPPSGFPLPHYNYFPYGPYFSPFYAPPPPFHQFLSNSAFPQQPHPGTLYPAATGANAKYPASQYEQGHPTSGASNHIDVPGNYGPYGLSSMANYTYGLATIPVTSTSNEEPQAKENNIYKESSGVWFATPNRDIPSIQASSFYNLPQVQLPYAPTRQTHGAITGTFHPSQAVMPGAVHPLLQQSQTMTSSELVGPNAGVYQQTQRAQVNWPGNY